MTPEETKALYKRLKEKGIDVSLVHKHNYYPVLEGKDEVSRTKINDGEGVPSKKGH